LNLQVFEEQLLRSLEVNVNFIRANLGEQNSLAPHEASKVAIKRCPSDFGLLLDRIDLLLEQVGLSTVLQQVD
jgi:hypothetical protein